jgi:hypothetical protein
MNAIGEFEAAVYREDFGAAVVHLHELLANFEATQGATADYEFLRIAAAITQLFINPRFRLTVDLYALLCASNRSLAAVFAYSDYGSGDHVIALLADVRDPTNLRFADAQLLMKCLVCYCPDSRYELNLQQVAQQLPDIVAPILLGLLGTDLYSRARIAGKLNALLERDWPFLHHYCPPLPQVLSLSSAWMNCSYATAPDKHAIKRPLNATIRNWLQQQGVRDSVCAPAPRRDRPRVLVPVEVFNSGHAMFRCFGRAVARLQSRFDVIGVAPEHGVDDTARAVFPHLQTFVPGEAFTDFAAFVDTLRELRADLIYYPSLGMANYTIALANLRLAPIQCFSLGHPATSNSASIDYVLVQEQDFTDASVFSEKVILVGNDTSPTIDPVRAVVPQPDVREATETVQVAVSSKHMKINHVFLSTCRRILDAARKPLQYHFFPGVSGYLHRYVSREIQAYLPGARVYSTTDFATYLRNLDRCHMRLGTFPFGGANTNMDCFGLGIPFVVLDGLQPHSHADAAQLAQAGLEQDLVAGSVEQYERIALRLVHDDQFRLRMSRTMLQLDSHGFFHKDPDTTQMSFPQTLHWLYRNHAAIQESSQRVWQLAAQTDAA